MTLLMTLLVSGILPTQGHAQPAIQPHAIFPLQGKHVHASSIVECPNGDMLVCWFHGSGERTANDVVIQGARLRQGSDTWSPVFVMADTPDFPDCNPVLFIDQKAQLWLFWIVVRANQWEQSILKTRVSTDYLRGDVPQWQWQDMILLKPGDTFAETMASTFKTLTPKEQMWAEYAPRYSTLLLEAARNRAKRQTGWMTRTHPTVLPDGRILLPLYSDGFNVSLVAISDDQGAHWRASAPIVGWGPIQPSIVRKKDGTLVAYMRDSGKTPNRALISRSTDRGESWSPATDTDIPNPGSSLEVIAMKDGRWVMVYNDTEAGRHSLVASLSDDEGRTWPWTRSLGRSERGHASFSYPSLIQAADASLHVTYSYHMQGRATIRHSRFKADWIMDVSQP